MVISTKLFPIMVETYHIIVYCTGLNEQREKRTYFFSSYYIIFFVYLDTRREIFFPLLNSYLFKLLVNISVFLVFIKIFIPIYAGND